MRGSAAFRTGVAPGGALAGPWVRDPLWTRARAVPSLDLRFADNKSLVDATTGAQLVTFTRASSGTFVDSDGLIQTAANDVPRFNHNPITGESLGLLVEEARTNLLLRSEEFDLADWTKTNSSITANAISAPTGAVTADKFVEGTTAATDSSIISATSISYVSGASYTFSFFAKAAERTSLRVVFHPNPFPGTAAQRTATFDLTLGSFSSVGSAYASSSVQAFSNGWYRISLSMVADATTTGNVTISIGTAAYTGNGTSGIYIWGAQLEAGAFSTSYIPTTTAAATRSADVASITGSNFSSWYRQDEGTVFADSTFAAINNTRIAAVSDNTTNNRIILSRGSGSSGNINMSVTDTTAQVTALVFATALAAGTSNKVAAVYKASDFAGSVNGLTAVTQNTGTVPSAVTQLGIGTGEVLGSNTMTGTIRRLTYWPTRLSNATLQQVTQ